MEGGILGEVRMFGGNFAPKGWAFCRGQLLETSDNAALFSLIGKTYGGDGITNFALPDLRDRVVIGAGSVRGLTPRTLGEKGGFYEIYMTHERMPSHNHTADFPDSFKASVTQYAYSGDGELTNDPMYHYPAETPEGTNIYSGSCNSEMFSFGINFDVLPQTTGVGTESPLSIVQPSIGTNYIISTSGDYPSRN